VLEEKQPGESPGGLDQPTLHRKPDPEEAAVVTTLQMLSFFIMPVGGLLIGLLALLWVRTWDDGDKPQPGE
jgi:hypothetical protein